MVGFGRSIEAVLVRLADLRSASKDEEKPKETMPTMRFTKHAKNDCRELAFVV